MARERVSVDLIGTVLGDAEGHGSTLDVDDQVFETFCLGPRRGFEGTGVAVVLGG